VFNTLKSQCIEVEELYAFGEGIESKSFWDTTYFKENALNEFSNGLEGIESGVSFFTPILTNHFRLFHPTCKVRTDINEFKQLVKIYNHLHQKNYKSDSLDIENTCNKVISDFKQFCKSDSTYSKMVSWLFDSAPQFKKDIKAKVKEVDVVNTMAINGGKLSILLSRDSSDIYLAYTKQNENNFKWVIAVGCYLSRYEFIEQSFNSLGYIIRIGNGINNSRIYLDKEERFRFYICESD
jgi:hypothetical protein